MRGSVALFWQIALSFLALQTVECIDQTSSHRHQQLLSASVSTSNSTEAGDPPPGSDTLVANETSATTSAPNVSSIMFGHGPSAVPPTAGDVARFAEQHARISAKSHASTRSTSQVGTSSDPWWLNPPPWWLPPPPEWGAAPVSMYSSFYNPGNVQNPRPDRVPSSFAPYPVMT